MKKISHIAKANVLRNKGAAVALFVIILIISALTTISLTLLINSEDSILETIERTNSAHSLFIISRSDYHSSFAEIIENDSRVALFEQTDVLIANGANVEYVTSREINAVIGYIGASATISVPIVVEEDISIPSNISIYLPIIWKTVGYEIGSPFVIEHRNREVDFIVAGFFETAILSNPEFGTAKFYATAESYERLTRYFSRAVWMTTMLHNLEDSRQFNQDFSDQIDIDISVFASGGGAFMLSIQDILDAMAALSIFVAIILLFAFILTIISVLVIRFRIQNSIENTMHEIGVLKAQGYTSRQIISCYILEYGAVTIPAAFLGIVAISPLFGIINQMLFEMTSMPILLNVNIIGGIIGALAIIAIILLIVIISARRIKHLTPVTALRGGIATNNFRRNFFPLNRFKGSVHIRLGFKNMFAYFKLYAMIGVVIASATFAIIFITALYQNLVVDPSGIAGIAGFETNEVTITVTRHTDAFALAEQLEQMPEVRMTSMLDFINYKINGIDAIMNRVSDDYSQLETFVAQIGRMPIYSNEIAMPRIFARQLGVEIGDGVMVTAAGITQEFILTGYFSTIELTNSSAITLEGMHRLNPDFARSTINVYLNEGVAFEDFSEKVARQFGVLNVFREVEGEGFAASRARAEERIAFYLEHFNVDSIDFAVMLDGEIVISGTSADFQIERITNNYEQGMATVQNLAGAITTLAQMIFAISLIIVSIVLSMTIRSIVAKRRRELGILKSSGYTTRQLVKQMAVSFLPMTAIGVAAGCIVGAILFGPMMGVATAAMGALNFSVTISPIIVATIGVAILTITYLVAHLSAMRIKKITVYELLTD
ncbi:MAG: FtsX-like permease family protein [Defluviitaleaceae bacterium]|nr:FtsX-like permease family protein [Defluviitaleaceae bacterium]